MSNTKKSNKKTGQGKTPFIARFLGVVNKKLKDFFKGGRGARRAALLHLLRANLDFPPEIP